MRQSKLFGSYPKATWSGNETLMLESAEIVNQAIIKVNPYAICMMLSGGDDSVTALNVALMLGVKIDFIIHGITGTGLPCVREYVRKVANRYRIWLIEADAGDAFEKYVLRKGFFGRGVSAHSFSYHLLKINPFDKAISKHIVKGRTGRKLILLNGVRVEESENRADNFGEVTARWTRNNCWVNIIHWWNKKDCLELLEAEKIERNPASIELGRSCECNCGTMQSSVDIDRVSEFDKDFGKWMTGLRKAVIAKHGWDIWQNPTKQQIEMRKLTADFPEFMPMCVGCKSRQNRLFV